MNPLPPLPLIDGHLFIDNSFLDRLCSCPRATEYSYLYKRRAADSASPLNFGGAIHHALAYRYVHCPDLVTPTDETAQLKLLENWFQEKPNPVEDHRQLDLASMLIRGYNKKYFGEEFSMLTLNDKPAVELPFAAPLYFSDRHKIQIMYCGKIDLVVRADEQLFIVDHKTTSIMGDGFFKYHSVNPQMFGYLWGAETLLKTIFAGFIINGIRVPRPTVKNGLEVKDADFGRLKVYIHEGQLPEWRYNTIFLIEEFLENYQKGFMPQKKSWCVHKYGTCDYFDVCSLPAENRSLMLQSGAFVDDEWSPLNNFHQTLQASKLCQTQNSNK